MRRATFAAAAMSAALSIQAVAQPIDVKTVEAEAIAAEKRSCQDYMAVHPDIASSYGPNVSIENYCACEANLLVGSVSPDELVRLMVDKQFDAKIGKRRHDTGTYCLGLLMRPRKVSQIR